VKTTKPSTTSTTAMATTPTMNAKKKVVHHLNLAINSPTLNDRKNVVALCSVSIHPKSRVFFQMPGLADCKKA